MDEEKKWSCRRSTKMLVWTQSKNDHVDIAQKCYYGQRAKMDKDQKWPCRRGAKMLLWRQSKNYHVDVAQKCYYGRRAKLIMQTWYKNVTVDVQQN